MQKYLKIVLFFKFYIKFILEVVLRVSLKTLTNSETKRGVRLLLFLSPYGHYSRYPTASLKLFEATSSSYIVSPCIGISAIVLRKLGFLEIPLIYNKHHFG
jgi:hypothetical protein